MSNDVKFSGEDAWIGFRFIDHAKLALNSTIQKHEKNWAEKVGDIGLWPSENLPQKAWKLMKEPRWINFVFTTLALVGVTYAFYPQATIEAAKRLARAIPLPTVEQVKFGAYVTCIHHILSAAFRAEGRFSNTDLMNKFYKNETT